MEDSCETYSDEVLSGDLKSMFALPEDDNLRAWAEVVLEHRREIEEIEKALAVKKNALAISEEALLRNMDERSVKSVTVHGHVGHSLILESASISHFRLQAGALEDHSVMTWLLRQGGGDLIERTVNAHVFSGFCRALQKGGWPIHKAVKMVTRRWIKVKEG